MKKILFALLSLILLVACSKNSHIPNTSILDEILSEELSDVLDYEKSHEINYGGFNGFEEMYPAIRGVVKEMSEIEKAKYARLTYRELVNAQIASSDSTLHNKYAKQWKEKYDSYLPKAKQIAKEMENNMLISYRLEATMSNSYGFSNFRNWLRRNGYSKYLSSAVVDMVYVNEDSWIYENIMKDKIDSDFDTESNWVAMKMLESVKDKYPLGYEFLLKRRQEYQSAMDELMRNL